MRACLIILIGQFQCRHHECSQNVRVAWLGIVYSRVTQVPILKRVKYNILGSTCQKSIIFVRCLQRNITPTASEIREVTYIGPLSERLLVLLPGDLHTYRVALHAVEVGVPGGGAVEELPPQDLPVQRQRRPHALHPLVEFG